MNEAVICDIDGTLALHDRSPYDYALVGTDRLAEDVLDVVTSVLRGGPAGMRLILVSGRPDSCRPDTVDWLARNGVSFDDLFMRETGDKRPDTEVKQEIYDKYLKGNVKVVAVFDDRDRVVKMWRGNGLRVYQVAEGAF